MLDLALYLRIAFQLQFKSVFSECSWSCGICFYNLLSSRHTPGSAPRAGWKKLAWPNGYLSGSSLSLHRGYGQSNTHSHIVAVCSLQLPPLTIPAIKLATGTLFFCFFGAQVQAFPLELKGYHFAQILGFILWSSGLRNRSLFCHVSFLVK